MKKKSKTAPTRWQVAYRSRREWLGLTNAQVAEGMGLTRQMFEKKLSRVETIENREQFLTDLAKNLGVSKRTLKHLAQQAQADLDNGKIKK